ncbi:iron ABC transporter permease [Candidatus Aerophobetes bacterium]|nr:iron ABC transporter permease [Candidatus Aerophobetes bacterium]
MLIAVVVVLLILVAYPLALVLLKSFSTGEIFSWENYFKIFTSRLNYIALFNTLYVGVAVTFLATLIGVTIAWLVTRTDIVGKSIIRNLIVLTFITPAYIEAIAWIQLLGRSGYINNLFRNFFNMKAPLIKLYSLEGIIFIMGIHLYPLVFLATSNVLYATDPLLEDAATLSGSRGFKMLTTITLPLALPSILSAAILVFIQTISCFGVAAVIGLPAGKYLLTTRVYTALSHYDVNIACAVSVILIIFAGIALFAYRMLLRKKRYIVTTSRTQLPTPIKLGKWKIPIALILFVFLSITVLLPLASIFLSSFLKTWGIPLSLKNLSLKNYGAVLFKEAVTARAFRNSSIFAAVAATAAIFIGFISSYFSIRTRIAGRRILDFLVTLPLAIPGPVLATAMILSFINLYNTPWIIIIAYTVAFAPYAVRNVSGALQKIDPALEEIGWMSGSSWIRTIKDIIFPLIKSGVFIGWILVFLIAIREIPLSTMLYTQGTETVGTLLFSLGFETGGLEVVSTIAVIVMGITIIGYLIIEPLGKIKWGD